MKKVASVGLVFAFLLGGGLASGINTIAHASSIADCNGSTFDTFTDGSVNGQSGWSATGSSYDQAVVDNTYGFSSFGCKSLRVSDAVTSGSFGDWIFSPAAATGAGESSVASDNHYEAQFDIASASSSEQAGMELSVAPTDASGSRMSYLRFQDEADGTHVFFDDVTDNATGTTATFNESDIATLAYGTSHAVKLTIDFVDGPANDTVKVYIDGNLVHTGTSWEDYYRYDPEQSGNGNVLPVTDRLIIQARGTSNPADLGSGYLFDNVSISTSDVPPPAPAVPVITGFTQNGKTLSCGATTNTNGTSPNTTMMTWTEGSAGITQYAITPTYPDGTGEYTYFPSGSALSAWIGDNFSKHGNGIYRYVIKAQGAGGWSAESNACTLAYDTQSPTAQFNPVPPTYVNGDFNVSGTASDNVALKGVFFDVRDPSITSGNSWVADCISTSTVVTYGAASTTANASCTINTSHLTEGHTYTLRIHAGDYAGYGGGQQQDLIVDRTKPTAEITSPAQSSTVAGSFTITGTATDTLSGVDHVDIYIEHDPWSAGGYVVDKQPAVWNATSGTFSYDASGIPDGVYAVKAVVYDKAGNFDYALSGNSGLIITVSNAVPSLTITAPAADGDYATGTYDFTAAYANGTSTNFDWAIRTGTSCSSGTVAGDVDGFSDASTLSSSTFSATLDTGTWSDGGYCFVVNDLHGLRATRLFTVDNTAPAAPALVSPADGATVDGTSVTQTWSDSDPAIDHFVYESFNNASATSLRWQQTFPSSTFSKTAANVATSTYWWQVEAFDAVGNMSVSPLWKLNISNVPAHPVTYVTTGAATGVGQLDATLNGTNGDYDAAGHSFWVSTSTFSTSSAAIPAGVYSTPDLGAIASGTAFSASLSSLTTDAIVNGQKVGTMPAIQPDTTYYYVAWSEVSGTWHPGAMQSFTTNPLGADATLSALGVSNGTLAPSFNPGVTTYIDTLPYNTTLVPTVTATTTDPHATVAITQATSTTGTATVTGTAQDGKTTQVYTVQFALAPATQSFMDVILTVDNSEGGTATSSDFTVKMIASNPSTSSFPGNPAGTLVTVNPDKNIDVNTVGSQAHYTETKNDCHIPSGLPAGNSVICTVTETYKPIGFFDSVEVGSGIGSNSGNNGAVLGASISGNDALEEQIYELQQQLVTLLQQYLALLNSKSH